MTRRGERFACAGTASNEPESLLDYERARPALSPNMPLAWAEEEAGGM